MSEDYTLMTKEKLVKLLEEEAARKEAAKGPPPHRQFLYRKECPKGKIFVGQEEIDKKLLEGWFDTPAKIGLPVEKSKPELEPGTALPDKDSDSDLKDKVSVAVILAKNSGLNHTVWMKALGLDPIKDREKTRKEYGVIVENFGKEYGEDKFTMTQHNWFIKE